MLVKEFINILLTNKDKDVELMDIINVFEGIVDINSILISPIDVNTIEFYFNLNKSIKE